VNIFLKFRHFITLSAQTIVAFAALGGSAASLVWLERQNAALPAPALPRWDETAPLIIVDAGHGGHDGGAVANEIIEKNLALDLARKVKRELEAAGLRVRTTRDSDIFLPLEDRAALAGKHQAAAFVSVHLNTDGAGSDAEGIETYYADSAPLSARQFASKPANSADFAAAVQRMVCTATKAQNRGTKARSYAVVVQAPCPAVLVECGFVSNSTERARMMTGEYRKRIAEGIAQGIIAYRKSN
jgi:N-acetylmuramoyl-L-alanine amidase